MSVRNLIRKKPNTAQLAKDRLQIIVARERTSTGDNVASYLPKLQQELLQVIAKYEKLDLDRVSVNIDKQKDGEVLEINISLPEPDEKEKPTRRSVRTRIAIA
ncbi:MAG TPA: cell division topological specificity factor MinE [Polyangiales bacterium]|jgi:cell division topological specificity factor|nr:cell division topological specificity factor MinE [Polyangiales bacterium]